MRGRDSFKRLVATCACALILGCGLLLCPVHSQQLSSTVPVKVDDSVYASDRRARASSTCGHPYILRDHIFDPHFVDAKGRSNLQRMEKGLAPIGKDGKSVQIHHFKQRGEAKRIEVTATEHRKIRHDKLGNSEIDRVEFAKERRQHWKLRRWDFH